MIGDEEIFGNLRGKTRKQHYLPRFFIQNFADDRKRLAVLQIINGKAKVTANRKAETICIERDMYEVAISESCNQVSFPNGIENIFSKIEGALSQKLNELFDALENCLDGRTCSKGEIEDFKCLLSVMVAFFAFRSPSFVYRVDEEADRWLSDLNGAGFSDRESIQLEMERILGRPIEAFGLTPELLARFLAVYSLVIPYNINGDVSLPQRLAHDLSHFHLAIKASPIDCPFAGIDFPAVIKYPLGDIGDDSCVFPLSSRFLACFCRDERSETPFVDLCSKEEVECLNKAILASKYWKVAFCCKRLPLDNFAYSNCSIDVVAADG